MAMKLLPATLLVLLISIGGIHSKTLLERIQDDSDLSQVRAHNFYGFIILIPSSCIWAKKSINFVEKLASKYVLSGYIIERKTSEKVLCNMIIFYALFCMLTSLNTFKLCISNLNPTNTESRNNYLKFVL